MKTSIIINSEFMGVGPIDLGRTLIGSYLRKIWANDNKPSAIVFYNSGAKLIAKGSNVLDVLDGLATSGVDLVACKTCINYFQLEDKISVGRVDSMEEIVNIINNSDKVITI